jgi:type I restriction enzyme S subunit
MAGERRQATFQQLLDEGLLEIGDGYRAQNNELGGTGPIFLRAGHVTDRHIDFAGVEHFHEHLADKVRSKMSKVGDTIITTKGNSTGRTSFVTDRLPPFVYSPHLSYWRSRDPEKLCGGFLRYWSQGVEFIEQLSGMKASTDMAPYLSLTDQRRLSVTLPPLAEQKAIAAVLGALDDKIELNRRMNATLEAMARALFQSWFVDFDPVRAKLDDRPPDALDPATAALFPEHLEDSPLGKKPIGWEVTVLENVLAVLETGGRPKGGVGGITSGVPSIGAESIVSVGVFDFGKTKYVPVEFHEGMRKGHIQSHDVLLYKDGGRPGEYEPHVSMFGDGFPFEKCSINEHVYRLRTSERLSQEYLYFWMTSEFALAEMRIKGTGVAIPGLNSTAVRSLGVLIPPPPIVQAFTKQAAPLFTRILANAKQSRTLATLRDTLLPKLLSGELSVTSASATMESSV